LLKYEGGDSGVRTEKGTDETRGKWKTLYKRLKQQACLSARRIGVKGPKREGRRAGKGSNLKEKKIRRIRKK